VAKGDAAIMKIKAILSLIVAFSFFLVAEVNGKTAEKVFELASKSTVEVLAYDGEGKIAAVGSGVVLPVNVAGPTPSSYFDEIQKHPFYGELTYEQQRRVLSAALDADQKDHPQDNTADPIKLAKTRDEYLDNYLLPEKNISRDVDPRLSKAAAWAENPDIGIVGTNCHVGKDASWMAVHYQEQDYPAIKRYSDLDRDVCTLSVIGLAAPPVVFADAKQLKVGARVYAIGAPHRLELTLSEGIISSLRSMDGEQYIQTTAPISHGSSGGGLFDKEGCLLGLTSFYLDEGQNLNFALPVGWIAELPNRQTITAGAKDKPSIEWLNQANKLTEKQDWAGLVKHAQSWTEVEPKSAVAWFNLGCAYIIENKASEAISAYRHAIEIDPEYASAWGNLASTYRMLDQTDKAIEAFQQVIRIKPKNPFEWIRLGEAYDKNGQFNKAIESYRQAIKIDPEYAGAWSSLGEGYDKNGQFNKAIESYRRAIRINPEYAGAWSNLGEAYDKNGQRAKAIEAFQQAIQIDPKNARAWFSSGVAYENNGETAMAISAYRQAVKINPEYASAWYNLGTAYRKTGQTDELMDIYRRLQKLDSDLADDFLNKIVLP